MEERITRAATTLTFTHYTDNGERLASDAFAHLIGTEFTMEGLLSSVTGKLIDAVVHESGEYAILTIEAPVYRTIYGSD